MCANTRQDTIGRDRVRNDSIIVKKRIDSQLRWFGHGWRRHVDFVIWRVNQMKGSPIARCRGRPQKTIEKLLRKS